MFEAKNSSEDSPLKLCSLLKALERLGFSDSAIANTANLDRVAPASDVLAPGICVRTSVFRPRCHTLTLTHAPQQRIRLIVTVLVIQHCQPAGDDQHQPHGDQ
ncbi:hypothetical protein RB195_009684 [Necator americanus]|uniref:Uncharacterized protein n=1 Tax=Necator americanus TaxID=51031 RepID=A0ABR1CUE7_NECAM